MNLKMITLTGDIEKTNIAYIAHIKNDEEASTSKVLTGHSTFDLFLMVDELKNEVRIWKI